MLLDAAYDASPRDLKENWAPVAGLVVVSVGLTTIAVAVVARAMVPAMPWAAAVALGAVVAPPDATAAIAVLRQVKIPHRLLTILEGESLLNDATALLIYRLAVGAVVAGAFSIRAVAPAFLLAVAGSLVAGPVLAWLMLVVTARVRDVPTAIILQFITTFGVWILAERVGLSGVLTMVCFAIAVSRRAPERTPARIRVPAYAVWDTVVFVVNVLAFVFIGLQIRPILSALEPGRRALYFQVAGAVLLTVIVVRVAWVMTHNAVLRWRIRRSGFHPPRPTLRPSVRSGLAVSWSGMRGIVTLAAALALPLQAGSAPFPFRDLIVFTAFSVVLGTLGHPGVDPEARSCRPSTCATTIRSGRRSSSRASARCRPRWPRSMATDRRRRRPCARSWPRISSRGHGRRRTGGRGPTTPTCTGARSPRRGGPSSR